MTNIRAVRLYTIEIKDTEGRVVFSTAAHWDNKNKRRALAQIEGLAPPPLVNVYTGRALATQSDYGGRRRGSGTGRLDQGR
jgi:hypothetical protein